MFCYYVNSNSAMGKFSIENKLSFVTIQVHQFVREDNTEIMKIIWRNLVEKNTRDFISRENH